MSTLTQVSNLDFNGDVAAKLAAHPLVRISDRWDGHGSARFAYFADAKTFAVVVGKDQKSDVDLAFAYGLTYRQGRRLVLVLPEECAFSTVQRAPWFTRDVRPKIFLHDGATIRKAPVITPKDTVDALSSRLKEGEKFEQELSASATPVHLGPRADDVFELVEWATSDLDLAPGHRQSERAWHCEGQKVLSIKGSHGGLLVRAGIHLSVDTSPNATVLRGEPLAGSRLEQIKALVKSGIEDRLHGGYCRADEHWLQAVIRDEPSLVGVEQPALRELPAWRPQCAALDPEEPGRWGRGFIDLVGVDGHGDIRVVETKLADNQDARLIFQGLDYYIWACANRKVIRERLGAPKRAKIQIHYVVGDTIDGKIHVSKFASAQAEGLDKTIPWRFQTVHNWFHPDGDTREIRSELLPLRTLPVPGVI